MKSPYLSRREEIVLSTISLIHERGVNNVSMKEIARREGVTEASLYKHFKSKDNLILAVMEYYEQYDSHIYRTLTSNHFDSRENISGYFNIYAEYYNGYREITSLIRAYDVLAYDSSFSQRAFEIRKRKSNFLTELVKEGQRNKELKASVSAENIAYILLGTFDRVIAMWRQNEYSFSLTDKVREIIENVLDAFGEEEDRRRKQ